MSPEVLTHENAGSKVAVNAVPLGVSTRRRDACGIRSHRLWLSASTSL